jgi:hypothetical protein
VAVETKEMKLLKPKEIKRKSLPKLHKKAWDLQSKFLRQKYADENGMVQCYTCPRKLHWKEMQMGHCFHGDRMDFELDDLRPQCCQCNYYKSGQGTIFMFNLISEIGKERVDVLNRKHKTGKVANLSEVEEIIRRYS